MRRPDGKPTGVAALPGRCPECGSRAGAPFPKGGHLFGCVACGGLVVAAAPPALPPRRGKSLTTPPDLPTGAALFVDRDAGTVTLATWTTPFLAGPVITVSLSEFRRLFGFD